MGKRLSIRLVTGIASFSAALFTTSLAQDGAPTTLAPFATTLSIEERRLAELDGTLEIAMETGDFVGLAVAVVQGGETRFLKTYGRVSVDDAAPVTPDTLFRIASLSKGFASSLVGLAVAAVGFVAIWARVQQGKKRRQRSTRWRRSRTLPACPNTATRSPSTRMASRRSWRFSQAQCQGRRRRRLVHWAT